MRSRERDRGDRREMEREEIRREGGRKGELGGRERVGYARMLETKSLEVIK